MRSKKYPFSNPVSKFLDCENGVVGKSGDDWEFKEGIAKEGSGEDRVTATAKEIRLDRKTGFELGFCKLADMVIGLG